MKRTVRDCQTRYSLFESIASSTGNNLNLAALQIIMEINSFEWILYLCHSFPVKVLLHVIFFKDVLHIKKYVLKDSPFLKEIHKNIWMFFHAHEFPRYTANSIIKYLVYPINKIFLCQSWHRKSLLPGGPPNDLGWPV